ncbi:MAG: hypothetical protein RIQ89_379 [Bacteroidota bacterium]
MKHTFLLFIMVCIMKCTIAQDLWSLAEQTGPEQKDFTTATFKNTRLINMHTVEVLGKRTLDFRISHRFGTVNSGIDNLFGLDGGASIRLGLEYSYDGRLMAGFGRTSYQKMLDGFLKYKLVRQTQDWHVPVSITLFSSAFYNMQKGITINNEPLYSKKQYRLSYAHQILIASKLNSHFSLQVAPWLLHYNIVNNTADNNTAYGAAMIARVKFTKRQAITFEYGYRMKKTIEKGYHDSFGIGYEIETGGHVFQIHVTNSFGIVENQFLTLTNDSWSNGGVRIGFNISRVFTL